MIPLIPTFEYFIGGWEPSLGEQWKSWKNGTEEAPQGGWYLVGLTDDQIRLGFSGDMGGPRQEFGMGFQRSRYGGAFGVDYEPTIAFQPRDYIWAYRSFKAALDLLNQPPDSGPFFKDFPGPGGGVLIFAQLANGAGVRMILFERDGPLEARRDLSPHSLRCLEEMARFMGAWVRDGTVDVPSIDIEQSQNQRNDNA